MNRLLFLKMSLYWVSEKANHPCRILSPEVWKANRYLTSFWTFHIEWSLRLLKNHPCCVPSLCERSWSGFWGDLLAEHRSNYFYGICWSWLVSFLHKDSFFQVSKEAPFYWCDFKLWCWRKILRGKGQQEGCSKVEVPNWRDRNW